MKNNYQIVAQSATISGRMKLVIAFFLFSNFIFAQGYTSDSPPADAEPRQSHTTVKGSELELLYWFMGSKQSKSEAGFMDDSATNRKKQLIRSGTMPNRILSRTFMNKAVNYERTLA